MPRSPASPRVGRPRRLVLRRPGPPVADQHGRGRRRDDHVLGGDLPVHDAPVVEVPKRPCECVEDRQDLLRGPRGLLHEAPGRRALRQARGRPAPRHALVRRHAAVHHGCQCGVGRAPEDGEQPEMLVRLQGRLDRSEVLDDPRAERRGHQPAPEGIRAAQGRAEPEARRTVLGIVVRGVGEPGLAELELRRPERALHAGAEAPPGRVGCEPDHVPVAQGQERHALVAHPERAPLLGLQEVLAAAVPDRGVVIGHARRDVDEIAVQVPAQEEPRACHGREAGCPVLMEEGDRH